MVIPNLASNPGKWPSLHVGPTHAFGVFHFLKGKPLDSVCSSKAACPVLVMWSRRTFDRAFLEAKISPGKNMGSGACLPFALLWLELALWLFLCSRVFGEGCFIETACGFTQGRKGLGGGSGCGSAFPAPPKAPGSAPVLPDFWLWSLSAEAASGPPLQPHPALSSPARSNLLAFNRLLFLSASEFQLREFPPRSLLPRTHKGPSTPHPPMVCVPMLLCTFLFSAQFVLDRQ